MTGVQTCALPIYASIDGDPDGNVEKKPNGCGGGKRHDYNQCLSQKRADMIAKTLNDALGVTKFVGHGGGETDKFAPGKKWPDSKREDTLPNRRFTVELPKYTEKVKVQ